jgi:hypothetical protein
MIPIFLIEGAIIAGGLLILLSRDKKETKDSEPPVESKKETEVSEFNLEEVRRLRRELKAQMRMKKKLTSSEDPNK